MSRGARRKTLVTFCQSNHLQATPASAEVLPTTTTHPAVPTETPVPPTTTCLIDLPGVRACV
jgi:hypothetical protein